MKTKEELNKIKAVVETLNKKLAELSQDELEQVMGGGDFTIPLPNSPEFWRSWNPCLSTKVAHSDTTGFIDSDDYIHKHTYE